MIGATPADPLPFTAKDELAGPRRGAILVDVSFSTTWEYADITAWVNAGPARGTIRADVDIFWVLTVAASGVDSTAVSIDSATPSANACDRLPKNELGFWCLPHRHQGAGKVYIAYRAVTGNGTDLRIVKQ